MGLMNERVVSQAHVSEPEAGGAQFSHISAQQACAEICKLKDWLGDQALNIPDYQRPYKWGVPQVQQLLRDIVLTQ